MDFVFHSFLPAWNIEPEHPLVAAASQAYRLVKGGEPVLFRMGASTNGVTTAGMFHLPTIVFGPGDLAQAHSTNAVSYTHLDVYKRQTVGWFSVFSRISPR